MSDPTQVYNASAFNEMIEKAKEPPKGLFQTNFDIGMLFYVVNWDGKNKFMKCPTHNNDEGVMVACDIMDREEFVCWAIDPWSGEVNIDWDDLE